MRAKGQVWSEKNESAEADPRAEQPQPKQTTPAQPERPETQPEIPETPSTPAADQVEKENGQVSRVPCVHVLEALFASLVNADTPAAVEPAPEDHALPVTPDFRGGTDGTSVQEVQPAAAFAGFAIGTAVLYQQERAVRKADEQKRRTRLVTAGR